MNELHLHHVHLFTNNLQFTIDWWVKCLNAKVEFDGVMGNSRNVFLKIGEGRLHFYDQRPKDYCPSSVHHIGIRVQNLEKLYLHLVSVGVNLRNPIRTFEHWSYAMCIAPDNVLLELFQVDEKEMTAPLKKYFSDSSSFCGE